MNNSAPKKATENPYDLLSSTKRSDSQGRARARPLAYNPYGVSQGAFFAGGLGLVSMGAILVCELCSLPSHVNVSNVSNIYISPGLHDFIQKI
jgi:hypothetical protein